MKSLKHIILISVAVMLVFSFNSCKKEGIYNPKQKIATIYKDYGDGQELYAKYIWNGNLLSSIIYPDAGATKYTYNSKNQTTKIEMEDSWADLEYDNAKLEEIKLYTEGTELCEIEFKHNGNKIVSAEMTIVDEELFFKQLVKKGSLTQHLFNAFVPSNMNMTLVHAYQNAPQSKGTGITLNINYSWAGKNISKVDASANILIFSLSMVSEYTYDNKTNPFYNGITFDFDDGDIFGFISSWMNQNNVLTCTSTMSVTGEEPEISQFSCQYEYEGNYPIKVVETEDDYCYATIYEYSK